MSDKFSGILWRGLAIVAVAIGAGIVQGFEPDLAEAGGMDASPVGSIAANDTVPNGEGLLLAKSHTSSGSGKGNRGNPNSGGNSQACGWYAIALCGTNRRDAEQATNQYGGFVVDTSDPDFPNFRDGYYCVVEGPYSQSGAEDVRDEMRDAGSRDAYVKNAC